MCDTMIVTSEGTADGVAVFGKNSDREPNEAQYIVHLPAANHSPGSTVRCTYIAVPQVEHTHAVLLSKPFWMWGAEMGANEYGLVIGNEAVWSKLPAPKGKALLGMDLLRLALERAANAPQALQVIISLLEEYGQGGDCGFTHPFYYHNSFLIADPQEAWVLETVARHWAARRVTGVASISNCLTIGNRFDLASDDLVGLAQRKGWCKRSEDFDFAHNYSDVIYTNFAKGRERCRRSQSLLNMNGKKDYLSAVFAILRDHGEEGRAGFQPDGSILDYTICAHAGYGPVRSAQTTGSLVAYLHPEHPVLFVTGTAAPCTSIFKPVWLDAGFPDTGPEPSGTFDPASLFWQHELLHRATLLDYNGRLELYRHERDRLEERFVGGAFELTGAPVGKRAEFTARCFTEAAAMEAQWLERVCNQKRHAQLAWHYSRAWKRFNWQAELTLPGHGNRGGR